jgi:D-xylose transport system substrate-binding protein
MGEFDGSTTPRERQEETILKKAVRWSAVVAVLAALVGTSVFIVGSAGASTKKKSAGILACGLMPDTKSSIRWEQFDKPYLLKAFKAAGIAARVVNAQNDAQKQKTQADQCIADGAKVLIIAPIDSGSAAAIEKAAAKKGVKSIDYDRQVEGGNAVLYASFDGHQVGVLQGSLVAKALKGKKGAVVAELNGGQEDANSFLFKGGYDSVLKPLYKSGAL